MTTVSSKHSRRDMGEPPMSVYKGSTLVDDMEVIRKLCLPGRQNPELRNASHLSVGIGDRGPVKTTNQLDFTNPGPSEESKGLREARSQYMRDKHFDLGYNEDPLQSESRSRFVPHGQPREKKIFNIGAPHNKNASSLFVSDPDKTKWSDDLDSGYRADYTTPGNARDPFNKAIANDHRSNHFDFGSDPPDMESHAKRCYKAPPPGFKRQQPAKSAASGVEFGSKDFPWSKDVNSTNRADYAKPFVADEDALTSFVKHGPPIKFGDDKREMLTEHRSAYKKNEFLDCSSLTDQQLKLLGVTREQIIPRKVPLPFLSSQVFRNALGQDFADAE
uniref:Uncharacterized protein n=1 Tax=Eutreptiella gymnastica TaxID=73025 RepID=A0A7S4G4J0_9EUGL|eukprot:CAMPEP_0174297944 /NCGR_PEP_ID=MMETSP0809-20121228/52414_1 /TAXON_ID=73025 ORGANISM="Eutreptiella gymnastica-like, Strain CCMP1594" /NCGR_SAMPLE_ID=MMETSP0809 /ASSEMBLY_ACC=CAM_ASM_000658 /LENGTH=331 /DNA_ID=CAMNT_0015402065 /DNA_START=29 /DNA_END=1024 /DNA_ORIENTATION=+